MAVVRRPKHWKQIRSKRPDGRPSISIPSRTPGPPFARSDASQYAVSTVSCYSTNNARLLCPGINISTHTTHHTPHTPPPPLAKLPSTVTSTTLPAPSHVLRTLHYAPGPGVEVGWARFTMRCHGSVQLHTTVSRCVRMCTDCTGRARSKSPPFTSDTTAATRITAWPQRQPHQGRERFRSSRWQYRDRALDHTRVGRCVHVLVLLYAPAPTLAPCDGSPCRARHGPMPNSKCQTPDGRRRSLMQEGSFLGREIAYCGIQRQTWVASKKV